MKGPSGAYSQSVLIVWMIKSQSSSATAERTQSSSTAFPYLGIDHKWHCISNIGRKEEVGYTFNPTGLLCFLQPMIRLNINGAVKLVARLILWHMEIPVDKFFFNVFVAFDFLILAKRTSGSDPEWDWWYSDDICAGAAQERWETGNETHFYNYDIRLVTKI